MVVRVGVAQNAIEGRCWECHAPSGQFVYETRLIGFVGGRRLRVAFLSHRLLM